MTLPDELLVQVLHNLDYRELLRCTRVCKNFKNIIWGTAALQYTIELAVSGQRDKSSCSHPDAPAQNRSSKEKLEALRKHQAAWKALKHSREIKIPMSTGSLWEIYGGVLAQNTEQGEIQFYQLPSDLRGIEEKRWTLSGDFGFRVSDFGMDPGQDLLVLVQTLDAPENDTTAHYRVHFYTMSTGKPHPLAARSMVALPETPFDPQVFQSIQIFGDFVGVHFDPDENDEPHIGLWNWKTGELLIHLYGEGLDSFTQLSERWMLVASSDTLGDPHLTVVDFVKEPPTRRSMEDLVTSFELEYPPLSGRDVYLTDIQLRADPGLFIDNRPGGMFCQDPKEFLIVLTTRLDVRNRDQCVIQCINSKLLLDVVEEFESISGKDTPVPYDDWVTDTRIRVVGSNSEPSDVWVCYVYGNKFVLGWPRSREGVRGYEAGMFDFTQLALKRDAQLSDDVESIKTQPNEIPRHKPFEDEIETCLPHRRSTLFLEGAHRHCKAMCTEDAVIIVDPECREYRVLVF